MRLGACAPLFCAVLLAAFGSGAAGDTAAAKRQLLEAIEAVDVAKASSAAQTIAGDGNSSAVSTLVKAIRVCALKNAKMLHELEEIEKKKRTLQPDRHKTIRGDAMEQMDKLQVKTHDFYKRFCDLEKVRTAIREALCRIDGEVSVGTLVGNVSSQGGAPEARADAAVALAAIDKPRAMDALLRALSRERDAGVKIAILQGIAKRADRARAVTNVGRLLHDPLWQVAVAAARCLEASACPDAIPVLIESLKKVEAKVKAEVNNALIGLSHVNKHANYEAWSYWWRTNEKAVRARSYKPPAGERAEKGAVQEGMTAFYGIPVNSDRIVFVIDASNSMHKETNWHPIRDGLVETGPAGRRTDLEPPIDNTKIAVAKFELKKVLHQLPDGVRFNIIFFNHTIWCYQYEGMVTLNRVTREQACKYIDETRLLLATDIYQAMKKAFEFGGALGYTLVPKEWNVDTIYLLSDGLPYLRAAVKEAGGIVAPETILEHVRQWNKDAKITIHTIGIHAAKPGEADAAAPDPPAAGGGADEKKKGKGKGKGQGKGGRGRGFLRKMAEENGGTYVER